LWRTTDGGQDWERVFSAASPGVDTLLHIGLPPEYGPDCQTIFLAGENGGHPVIWSSNDNGQTFRSRVSRLPDSSADLTLDTWVIENKTTLYIGHYDGAQSYIYKTVNGGFSFSGGGAAGSSPLYSIALSPGFTGDRTIIAGSRAGSVYLSKDGGTSFTALPTETDTAPLTGNIDTAFDPSFTENGLIYVSSCTAGAGFYRFDTGEGGVWESINSGLPVDAVIDHVAITGGGVLYGINSIANGGMERCLAPGRSGPLLDTVNRGLSAGATLSCISAAGTHIWAADTANCRLMSYLDTLTTPTHQTSPENGASGVGRVTDTEVLDITLKWDTLDGAASYEWQCADNRDFTFIPAGLEGTVTGSSVRLPALEPATVYYWRVRAKTPALSPWSEVWSFATSLAAQLVPLRPESPAAGENGTALKPVFQWTAVIGASGYELLVASDADFENPVIIRENDYALPANAWKSDVVLDYGTTYYWKVRAVTASTHSIWSATGVFTTLPAPPEEILDDDTPEISLLDDQNPGTLPAGTPLPSTTTEPATTPPASPVTTTITTTAQQGVTLPPWAIYLIGGLIVTVMLALIVVLAAVLKLKR
jgi:hypothetical protein